MIQDQILEKVRLGCPVIEVSNLAIEETARRIVRLVEERSDVMEEGLPRRLVDPPGGVAAVGRAGPGGVDLVGRAGAVRRGGPPPGPGGDGARLGCRGRGRSGRGAARGGVGPVGAGGA